MGSRPCFGGNRRERDLIPQADQLFDQSGTDCLLVHPIEKISTQLRIRALPCQKIVGNSQHRVRHGYDRLLLALANDEVFVLGSQIRVLGAGRGPGRFTERSPQPNVAFGRFSGETFPSALIIAGTYPCPFR